jgi:hypothetical protein
LCPFSFLSAAGRVKRRQPGCLGAAVPLRITNQIRGIETMLIITDLPDIMEALFGQQCRLQSLPDKFSPDADFVSVSDVRTVKLPSPQTFELA